MSLPGTTELLGREDRITWADGRLRVTALDDGRTRLDAGAADLLGTWHGYVTGPPVGEEPGSPEHLLLALAFSSAEFLVDGRPRERRPFRLLLPLDAGDTVLELVRELRVALLEVRRTVVDGSALVVRDPGARTDVDGAVARMVERRRTEAAVALLPHYVHPDEFVLEVAAAGFDTLVVLTRVRVLFLAPHRGVAHEFPLAGVYRAWTAPGPDGTHTQLFLDDGFDGLPFVELAVRDAARLAGAVRHALRIEDLDGLLAPRRPDSAELFAEWQLLSERRALRMVDDDDWRALGSGILSSLP